MQEINFSDVFIGTTHSSYNGFVYLAPEALFYMGQKNVSFRPLAESDFSAGWAGKIRLVTVRIGTKLIACDIDYDRQVLIPSLKSHTESEIRSAFAKREKFVSAWRATASYEQVQGWLSFWQKAEEIWA